MRVAIMLLASAALYAAADVKGKWLLTASADGEEHRVDLVLKEEAGKLGGTISTVDFEVALEEVRLEGDELSYKVPARGGCSMKLTVRGDSLKGTYTCSDGATGPVTAVRPAAGSASVAGKWKGAANSSGGRRYDLELELTVEGGKASGTLSTGEGSVAVEDGRVEGDKLSFKLSTDQGVYTVNLTVAGSQMKGRYSGPAGETGDVNVSR
jgi:hypothetical protein